MTLVYLINLKEKQNFKQNSIERSECLGYVHETLI